MHASAEMQSGTLGRTPLTVPRRQACLPDEASHQGPEARLAMITLFGDPEHWLGLSNKGWRCKRTWTINQLCG